MRARSGSALDFSYLARLGLISVVVGLQLRENVGVDLFLLTTSLLKVGVGLRCVRAAGVLADRCGSAEVPVRQVPQGASD